MKDKQKLFSILNHEKGHLAIAYLVANELQKRLTKTYTSNYIKESKAIADKVFSDFRKLEYDYDVETKHSLNKAKQIDWDNRIKLMFKN